MAVVVPPSGKASLTRQVRGARVAGITSAVLPDGLVTDDLIDFHRGFARGGVGMTTVAYCCVSAEGAGAPEHIVMSRRRCRVCNV